MTESSSSDSSRQPPRGNVPIPDPTVLTTAQLGRAIESEREYVNGQLSIRDERLNAMDRATKLLDETVNRTPTLIQTEIQHIREIMDERQLQTATQFAAQKEAVAKAETSDEKRFESVDIFRRQLSEQMANVMSRQEADVRITGISEKLDAESKRNTERTNELELRLTNQLTLMQGNKQGGQEFKSGLYALLGAVAGVATLLGVLAAAGVFGGS